MKDNKAIKHLQRRPKVSTKNLNSKSRKPETEVIVENN